MSQAKGKTLSEKLAELANPTPQFADPEDEYNEETKARLESFDDQYESNNIVSKKSLKSKSSLRQKNVELLAVSDKRYAGKRVSRKDLEEVDEDDYNIEPSEESLSESDEDANDILEFKSKFLKETKAKLKKTSSKSYRDDNSSINSDIDEEESSENEKAGFHKKVDREEEEDDDDGEEEEDDDDGEEEEEDEEDLEDEEEEEDDGEEEDKEENLEDEEQDMEEDGASVDDNEENDSKKLSSSSHENDINKGKSIQNQLSLWDHLLECRIKLHKGINLSNQLPQASSSYKLFTKVTGENHFVMAGQGAQLAIKTLLDSCLELQDLLLKSNSQTKSLVKHKSNGAEQDGSDEEIPSDTDEEAELDEEEAFDGAPKRKKLKVSEYESEIGGRHESFRAFSNRTLNMWNEKTRLASGRTGVGAKSGFGAFDQSILKQIEGILSDKQRLINRTRIKRSTYRILGCIKKPLEVVENSKEEVPKTDDAPPSETKPTDFEEFDPEIYDDDDFYHQLLRELIEKRTGEAGSNQVALGRQWLEIQKLRSKAKRKVDSKASKGRRLRYQVHPKLVSFMAPYPETSWNDIAKNELFASLFGSGLTVT